MKTKSLPNVGVWPARLYQMRLEESLPNVGALAHVCLAKALFQQVREAETDGERQRHRTASRDSHGGLSSQRKNLISQLVEHRASPYHALLLVTWMTMNLNLSSMLPYTNTSADVNAPL